MNFVCRYLLVLVLAGLAAVIAGCSDGAGTITTEPVQGVVTLDGNPVAEATVTFRPIMEGQGLPASGITDASGAYTLTARPAGGATAKPGGGTLPGEYYVSVVKMELGEELTDDEIEEQEVSEGELTDGGMTYILPERYSDLKESGLKVTIKAGMNNIPLELTTEP